MNAAVFLNRDNTIVHCDGGLGDPKQVRLIQGAASAIASLRGLGYLIVVITNQDEVADGKYSVQDVDKVHEKITELVYGNAGAKIDRFYFCPYHPDGKVEKYAREHPWRKPQPGMLLQAAKDLQIDMEQSWMIGDALCDVHAGAAAGVRTILLKPDAQALPPLKASAHGAGDDQVRPDFVAGSLIEATRVIAQQRRPDRIPEDWEPAGEKVNKNVQPARNGNPPPTKSPKRSTSKPFRPWNAPASEQVSVEPETSLPRPTEPEPQTPEQATAEPEKLVSEPPKPAPAPAPVAQPEPASRPTLPAEESELDEPTVLLPEKPRPPTPETQTPAADADADAPEPMRFEGGATRLLRLIHQELKNQYANTGEFSWLRMFAVMLQMIAIVCMFTSLWLGAGSSDRSGFETFMYMMGVAMFTQLATIAMLMFDRR